MDHLLYSELGRRELSAIPTVAHRENVAVEVLRAAWRRRLLCVAFALATAGLAVAFLASRPPSYPAEAIVELHVGRADPASGENANGVQIEASAIVVSEVRIIRSRMIAARVVERLRLVEDPAFMRDGAFTRITERLERMIGVSTDARDPLAEAERRLSRNLSVETDNRSFLVSIRFTGGRPEFAALVANTVAEEYLARRLEATMDTAGHTAAWLTAQVTTAEQQMQAADAAVRAFRERTGIVQLGATGDTLRQQSVRAVAAQLEALVAEGRGQERHLLVVEAALRAGGASVAAAELSMMPPVLAASQLVATTRRDFAEVQSRLGPRHPTYEQAQVAQIAAEAQLEEAVENGLAALRTGLDARRAAEAGLRARLDRLEQDLVSEADHQAELANLVSHATAARDRVLALSRSRDQARGLRELRIVPASLIAPAQPPRQASRPNIFLVGFGALIAGLLAGISLSTLLERREHGLRTTHDVTEATGQRCVGLVPERSTSDPPLIEKGWAAETSGQIMFDEAVRTVASSIGLFNAMRREGGHVVVVSSAQAGEGRSTLCAGLARALNMAGRRVLLIDGPPRRFDSGALQTSPVVAEGSHELRPLTQGPAGSDTLVLAPNEPAAISLDVFSSPDATAALEQARRHFDVIIIEGPPVLLVADSLVLGRIADSVLHVIRWGVTTRRDVRAALKRMQDHGVTVDGVVLTRVDVTAHARLGLADSAAHHLSEHGYYARKAPRRPAKSLAHG